MATLPKREWSEMTWADFTAADTSRWIAVLPLAATEQHGPHLPLGVDSFIADAYLARVRLGMLAVPVGWHRFGYPEGTFDAEERRHGIHGGDTETSLMLAGRRDTV